MEHQTVKSVPRQGWTRHLIIVGVSAPFANGGEDNDQERAIVHETCRGMAHVFAEVNSQGRCQVVFLILLDHRRESEHT